MQAVQHTNMLLDDSRVVETLTNIMCYRQCDIFDIFGIVYFYCMKLSVMEADDSPNGKPIRVTESVFLTRENSVWQFISANHKESWPIFLVVEPESFDMESGVGKLSIPNNLRGGKSHNLWPSLFSDWVLQVETENNHYTMQQYNLTHYFSGFSNALILIWITSPCSPINVHYFFFLTYWKPFGKRYAFMTNIVFYNTPSQNALYANGIALLITSDFCVYYWLNCGSIDNQRTNQRGAAVVFLKCAAV